MGQRHSLFVSHGRKSSIHLHLDRSRRNHSYDGPMATLRLQGSGTQRYGNFQFQHVARYRGSERQHDPFNERHGNSVRLDLYGLHDRDRHLQRPYHDGAATVRRLLLLLTLSALSCAAQGIGGKAGIGGNAGFGGGAAAGATSFVYVTSSVTGCFDDDGGTTDCVYALHVNPSAGNLIACEATWLDSGAVNFTLTGSRSSSFTAIGSKTGTAGESSQNFWVLAAGGGTETITGHSSASNNYHSFECAVYSFSGTLSSLDGTPGYSNTAAVGSVATLNGTTMGTDLITTETSDLLFASCNSVQGNCSQGTGFTSHDDTNACHYIAGSCTTGNSFNGYDGGLVEEKVNVTAGTQTATFGTNMVTSSFTGGLVAF